VNCAVWVKAIVVLSRLFIRSFFVCPSFRFNLSLSVRTLGFSSRARERDYECTEKHSGNAKNAPIRGDALACVLVPKRHAPKTTANKPTPKVPNKIADAGAKPSDTFVGATCGGVSLPYEEATL
jgi:hypothetical protein